MVLSQSPLKIQFQCFLAPSITDEKSDGNVILLHKQGTSLIEFGICSLLASF